MCGRRQTCRRLYEGKAMSCATVWKIKDGELSLERPLIMGIVNVTPDSFSDGGIHNGLAGALEWARKLAAEGADILDVGGESTRPGAIEVSVEKELSRVVSVVEVLAREGYTVSVDTSKPEVMRASIEAGAKILNDVRAFEFPGAAEVAAQSGAGLVIMHMKGTPQTMQINPDYADLIAEVVSYLKTREEALISEGVDAQCICWDAGFGFGKTAEHCMSVLKHTEAFVESGRPYLMGLSRKSAIGAVTGVEVPAARLGGSVAGALIAVQSGAQIVRVHDVAPTKQALDVWHAVQAAP